MSDIITLSSDDEYEPAPKKIKTSTDPMVQALKEELRARDMFNGHSAFVSITDKPSTNFSITITPVNMFSQQQTNTEPNSCHQEKNNTTEVNRNAKSSDYLVISDDEPEQSNQETCCKDVSAGEVVEIDERELCKETSLTDASSRSPDIAEISESDTIIEGQVATNGVEGTSTEAASDVEGTKECTTSPECGGETETEHIELPPYMSSFLNACAKSLKNSVYETRVVGKFAKMKKNFISSEILQNDPNFKKTVEQCTTRAKTSAIESIQAYRDVNSYIMDVVKGSFIEIPEENLAKVKKLEKFINKITKKIKKLEESEVDFDSGKNSVYMQQDRYSKRLKQAYEKYSQLLGQNSCREKIQFVSSHYNEINRAISHSYKYNKFPNYSDIEKIVKKCVKKHHLALNEAEIKHESKECFIKLGNLLQLKRKRKLYETHRQLLVTMDEGDPASKDPVLAEKLKKSAKQGQEQLQEVFAKYASMQEKNEKNDVVEQPLSADSDDSHYESSCNGDDDDDGDD